MQEGHSYLKLQKQTEAIDAYTKAAELSDNPGKAYFNICATLYNTGDMNGVLKSCDKAIQFDPNKADAWFIKGSAMFGKGEPDRSGKYMPPNGTADALNKYLELDPNGEHAADVKEMLKMIEGK
jgi:tetratricopeptide (TPR) repeat protein